jgi:hypothetical protein
MVEAWKAYDEGHLESTREDQPGLQPAQQLSKLID